MLTLNPEGRRQQLEVRNRSLSWATRGRPEACFGRRLRGAGTVGSSRPSLGNLPTGFQVLDTSVACAAPHACMHV